MQLRNVFPVVVLSLLSFSAMALEKDLCLVTSDIDNNTAKIVYEMDSDNRAIEHLYQDSFQGGVRISRIELKADGLKNGIVLNRKDKYETVRMHSDNFDAERGGVLYLDTLYSGVNGQRKEYVMELAMDKDGPVMISNKQEFRKMHFIAKRSKVFGIIGIERVVFGN